MFQTVNELPDTFQFVSDSQDVQPIREFVQGFNQHYGRFDSYFVLADHSAIYGMFGIVPNLANPVYMCILSNR